jgi:hypothetical protein
MLTDPAFAAIDAHPFTGGFGRRYYPLVLGDKRRDESFAVVEQSQPLLLALCTVGEDTLDFYGMPIQIFARAGLSADELIVAIDMAFAQFDGLAAATGVGRITIIDDATNAAPLKQAAEPRGYVGSNHDYAQADLSKDEAGLRQGLRRRFKPFLNWGQRSLSLEIFAAKNPDPALFQKYQEFHRKIAGRTTRQQDSWDVMADWIAAGHGELILASLDGELVAGTMIVDGTSTAFYASGVYDRERFDKPLGHWPLWLAILNARERGLQVFDIGEIPHEGAASGKEVNIGYFKSGFTSTIVTRTIWTSERKIQESQ